jgi:uncharacterized protein
MNLRLLFLPFVLLFYSIASAQVNGTVYAEEIKKFQEELDREYKNAKHSPLSSKDRTKFRGHLYFRTDARYCVKARLIRTPDEKSFMMPTTQGTKAEYMRYGYILFTLDSLECKLNVYQSPGISKKQGFEDYLFLPFRDLTNGESTYDGGRFIDVRIPKDDVLIVDFNKAYNPYCAYSQDYACPVTPKENTLNTEIRAGVQLKKK